MMKEPGGSDTGDKLISLLQEASESLYDRHVLGWFSPTPTEVDGYQAAFAPRYGFELPTPCRGGDHRPPEPANRILLPPSAHGLNDACKVLRATIPREA